MENKNPKFELESNRKVFFQLGFFIIGTVTLMAFTYKTPVYLNEKSSIEQEIDVPIVLVEKQNDPIIEIPKVEKLLDAGPSTPIFSTNLLSNVKATKSLDDDPKSVITTSKNPISITAFNVDPGIAPDLAAVVVYPDVDPKFEGNWLIYLKNELKYPEQSRVFNESGTAYVKFIVEVDGTVTDVKVLNKNLSASLQQEAIRVVKASPKWKPGSKNGEKVRSPQTVKINFVLK
ncbi:MAG TPA: TonB family protein [Brumimicrobium sp.]|nr:TonB family protein [Brumimicrobium sp.]